MDTKLHPDEQFESVDDEHEPPCARQLNNLIGCGGEDDVRLLETRYEREGDGFDTWWVTLIGHLVGSDLQWYPSRSLTK